MDTKDNPRRKGKVRTGDSDKGKILIWDKRGDAILTMSVMDSPENLSAAFQAAGHILDRSPQSCRGRWYRYLKYHTNIPKVSNLKESVILTAVSMPRNEPIRKSLSKKKSIWGGISNLIIRIMKKLR